MISFQELQSKLLQESLSIIIVSHRSPDGDSIGSSLGMFHLLKHLGHQVQVITPDPAPEFLAWLEGFDQVINFEKQREETEKSIKNAAIIFCLDFNTLVRTASLEQDIRANKDALLINLDHHQDQVSSLGHHQTCQNLRDLEFLNLHLLLCPHFPLKL